MSQHCVRFDSTVHSTHGGFLSSLGFRLGAPGLRIRDGERATCRVEDRHLLMAGQVEIRNRPISEAPHRRGAVGIGGLPKHVIDLSRETATLDDRLRLAGSGDLRVIANGGESLVVSRLLH